MVVKRESNDEDKWMQYQYDITISYVMLLC